MHLRHSPTPRIAVIGAGMAGLSAAAYLSQLGCAVHVFEAAAQAGGRTRSVNLHGTAVDNGQHLLLGAYQHTLQLLAQCGIDEQEVLLRMPFHWHIAPLNIQSQGGKFPRLALAYALTQAQGISWPQRWQLARLMLALAWHGKQKLSALIPAGDCSVQQWLVAQGQSQHLVDYLWQPLCLAALNTPIEQASARSFVHVLHDALLSSANASDMLLPRHDLSLALVQPLLCQLAQRGVAMHSRHQVNDIHADQAGLHLRFAQASNNHAPFSHVVVALAPHQLKTLQHCLPQTSAWAAQLRYQPICTVYLQYPSEVQLSAPLLGFALASNVASSAVSQLADQPVQWLFDRGQICQQKGLLAAVISAQGPHMQLDKQPLIALMQQQVQALLPAHSPAPLWAECIREKRATFSCDVGIAKPSLNSELPNVLLAGDYLHPDYPATIESAVHSGYQCAKQIEASLLSR